LFSLTDRRIAEEINASFRRFGPLVVDWPHKAESKSYFPPKGYAFLLFQVFPALLFGVSCWARTDFTGFYWNSLGLAGFYWILPGFNRFSMSFTGFH